MITSVLGSSYVVRSFRSEAAVGVVAGGLYMWGSSGIYSRLKGATYQLLSGPTAINHKCCAADERCGW